MRRSLFSGFFLTILLIAACETGTRPEREASAPDRSIAMGPPTTQITFGPRTGQTWSSHVKYRWAGSDDDGVITGFRYAITSVDEFVFDGYPDRGIVSEYIAWIDTLTYRPLPGGDRGPSPWTDTAADSVELTLPDNGRPYIFAVRAVDDEGLEDPLLERDRNAMVFRVSSYLAGPWIALASNLGAIWRTGEADRLVEVFAQPTEFSWSSRPGPTGTATTGYQYAVDDTITWSAVSLATVRFPEEEESFWEPTPGDHEFFVKAWDEAGLSTTQSARLRVWSGPRECAGLRDILVVLDTDTDQLQQIQILPPSYAATERALVDEWFAGYEFRVHETMGEIAPSPADMNCASSIFWFHTSEVDAGDASVLQSHHLDRNVLQSWVASGGNLFIGGIRPGNAIRYFHDPVSPVVIQSSYPVFFPPEHQPLRLAHWAASHLGIERIEDTVGNTLGTPDPTRRLRVATSAIRGRFGAYPDLEFDPLTWPNGPMEGGFGFYDRGVHPVDGAEVVYTLNDTDIPLAIRWTRRSDGFGKTVYLGFHPYFLQRPQVRELFRAVLTDFGEHGRFVGVEPDRQ